MSKHHARPPLWEHDDLDFLLAQARGRYALEFAPVVAGGTTLQILQIADMRDLLDRVIARTGLEDALHTLPLWAKIWPASILLGHFARTVAPQHDSLLEIGAGCGVTGLMAAAAGIPRVCITDNNEDALLFVRINVLRNGLQDRVEVRRADIRTDRLDERFSCIVGTEILYLEDLYRPLVKFLSRHMALENGEAVLAADYRRRPERFFKLAEKVFSIARKDVGMRSTGDDRERHLVSLHRLTRRG